MTSGPCFRTEDEEFQDYEFEDPPGARDGDDASCGDEFESAADFFAVDFFAVDFFAVDFFAVDFFAVDFFAVDFFAVVFFAVVFFAVVFFAVVFFAVDSAALDDVASALVVAGVVTAEACVTGESIACHCGDAAGSIIRRHNHQPPTTTPPRTARLKSLRMERTLTATRYPRHRLPTPQPALSAERNFSSAAPLLQKACC